MSTSPVSTMRYADVPDHVLLAKRQQLEADYLGMGSIAPVPGDPSWTRANDIIADMARVDEELEHRGLLPEPAR